MTAVLLITTTEYYYTQPPIITGYQSGGYHGDHRLWRWSLITGHWPLALADNSVRRSRIYAGSNDFTVAQRFVHFLERHPLVVLVAGVGRRLLLARLEDAEDLVLDLCTLLCRRSGSVAHRA